MHILFSQNQTFSFVGKLYLREDYQERFGLKSSLCLERSNCKRRSFIPTSGIVNNGRSFDVSRRAVYLALDSGIGFGTISEYPSKEKYLLVSIIFDAVHQRKIRNSKFHTHIRASNDPFESSNGFLSVGFPAFITKCWHDEFYY